MTQSAGHPQDDPWIEHQVAEMTRQIEVFEPPQERWSCPCSACTELAHDWVKALARHLVANQPENLMHPELLKMAVQMVSNGHQNMCDYNAPPPETQCQCGVWEAEAAIKMARFLGVGPGEAPK